MDESIRIYIPKAQIEIEKKPEDWSDIMVDRKAAEEYQKNNLRKFINVGPKKTERKQPKHEHTETRMETLKRVLVEKEANIHVLEELHPWVAPAFKRLIALLLAILFVGSFWIWAANQKAEKEEGIRATAYADGKTDLLNEQKAAKEAEENSFTARKKKLDDQMASDIQMLAAFLQAIEAFEDHPDYEYTPVDVETYGQCPVNRVLDDTEFAWCKTLEQAIMQENQWVGILKKNQATARNVQIATKLVERLYGVLYPEFYPDADPMPCSSKYLWAIFTKDGLYLTSNYQHPDFSNTWRAG